jgi:hypothetical protein
MLMTVDVEEEMLVDIVGDEVIDLIAEIASGTNV